MIFVDAGALIAAYHEEDPFWAAADEGFALLEQSEESIGTTSLCIAEAMSVLSARMGHKEAARAGMDILEWEMEILRPTLADERRAVKLMETYAEKGVGYVDCVSFVMIDAREIRTAFTFDEAHFVKVRKLKPWVPIPRAKRKP